MFCVPNHVDIGVTLALSKEKGSRPIAHNSRKELVYIKSSNEYIGSVTSVYRESLTLHVLVTGEGRDRELTHDDHVIQKRKENLELDACPSHKL